MRESLFIDVLFSGKNCTTHTNTHTHSEVIVLLQKGHNIRRSFFIFHFLCFLISGNCRISTGSPQDPDVLTRWSVCTLGKQNGSTGYCEGKNRETERTNQKNETKKSNKQGKHLNKNERWKETGGQDDGRDGKKKECSHRLSLLKGGLTKHECIPWRISKWCPKGVTCVLRSTQTLLLSHKYTRLRLHRSLPVVDAWFVFLPEIFGFFLRWKYIYLFSHPGQ